MGHRFVCVALDAVSLLARVAGCDELRYIKHIPAMARGWRDGDSGSTAHNLPFLIMRAMIVFGVRW